MCLLTDLDPAHVPRVSVGAPCGLGEQGDDILAVRRAV